MSFEMKIADKGEVNTGGEWSVTEGNQEDIVTLAEAKNFIKQQYGTLEVEDNLVVLMIQSARQWIERYIGQSIIKKEITVYTRDQLAMFELPMHPVVLTAGELEEVVRIDYEGNETALTKNTDYVMDGLTKKRLYFYQVWGTVSGGAVAGVRVKYYAYMTEVPKPLKEATLKLVAENYYNRSSDGETTISMVPFDVRTMCNPFKAFAL